MAAWTIGRRSSTKLRDGPEKSHLQWTALAGRQMRSTNLCNRRKPLTLYHTKWEHVGLSAVVSAATYFGMCRYYGRQPALGELLVCEGIGIAAGAAPDILEPAVDPHHRALGHSVALGTALT